MDSHKKELLDLIKRKSENLKTNQENNIDTPYFLEGFSLEVFKPSENYNEKDLFYFEYENKFKIKLIFWTTEKLLIIQDESKHMWKYRRVNTQTTKEIQEIIESAFPYPILKDKGYIDFVNWVEIIALQIQELQKT